MSLKYRLYLHSCMVYLKVFTLLFRAYSYADIHIRSVDHIIQVTLMSIVFQKMNIYKLN